MKLEGFLCSWIVELWWLSFIGRYEARSLRMRDNHENAVGVANDSEIETVAAVDSPLPDLVRPAVFLCIQRWVTEVLL